MDIIIQLPYFVHSDESEKRRHEIERQLIDDDCGILYINDSATIKNFKEEQ